MRKILFTLIMLLSSTMIWAYDFVIDGIFYSVISMTDLTVKVVSEDETYTKSYSGNVVIPNSIVYRDRTFNVIEIAGKAFMKCPQLTSVSIPKSVSIISSDAFNESINIEKIIIEDGDSILLTNRCFNNMSISTLYQGRNIDFDFKNCRNLKKITLGSNVTTINRQAFEGCLSLTEIDLPNSVETIGGFAFNGCSSLTEIDLPNSVETIGESAFNDCSSLTEIDLPNSVETIGESAFNDCSSLTEIDIPNSVETIGGYAFSNCVALTRISLTNNIKEISEGMFANCTKLSNIVIPSAVTAVGSHAFSGCSALTNIEIPNNVEKLGKGAFTACTSLKNAKLPNNITEINAELFSECSGLLSIELGDKVHLIREKAFYNCKSLTDINIPGMVTEIEQKAFEGCTSLENLRIEDYVSGSEYVNDKLYNKYKSDGITVYFKVNGENSIYFYAWNDAGNLLGTFPGTRITNYLTSITGDRYAYYTFPKHIKKFNILFYGDIARDFGYISHCQTVDINNITSNSVFKKTYMSGGKMLVENVNYLGYDFFDYDYDVSILETNNNFVNSSLKSIYLGREVYGTFENNSNLKEVTFGSDLTKINPGLFSGCSSLQKISIPGQVKSICSYAFKDCKSLESLSLSSGLNPIYLSNFAFENCNLTSLYLDREVYNTDAFYAQTKIKSLKLGSNFSDINVISFASLSNLTNLTIDDGNSDIVIGSLLATAPLETIYVGRNGNYKFNKETIQKVFFGKTVTIIPSDAFSSCVNIINVHSLNTIPPVGVEFNTKTYLNGTLYVSKGCKEAYMNADGWKGFWEIVETEESSAIVDVHEDVSVEIKETDIQYYNLQGARVAKENLTQGMYIKKIGNNSQKVIIK